MTLLSNYFNKVTESQRSSAVIAYLAALDYLKSTNPSISQSIIQELKDQRSNLKLIASENYSSLAVQLAMGNLLTDKYSEGYPFKRFYAGCDNVDAIESTAVEELKKLFGCEHAYVQPHSGADANLVAFWSILVNKVQNKEIERLGKKTLEELTPEEYEKIRIHLCSQKVMGMSLNSGGHLTHGYRHNVSSKFMQSFPYDVNPETGLLDYKELEKRVCEVKPLILIAGYSAYPRAINFAKMREIADKAGAVLMVDMAHFAGLVAGKVFTGEYNPIPYADIVTSTTHKTLRGPRGGMLLCTNEYKDIVDKGCPLILGGPLPHVMAAKAIAFKEANTPEFQKYAQQVVANSKTLADALQSKGVRVSTGSTENHLCVFDVYSTFGLTGRQAEQALRQARLTVNRNSIPNDAQGAWFTSGVRIGTPAITTLGMKEKEMHEVADCIFTLLKASKPEHEADGKVSRSKVKVDQNVLQTVQDKVSGLLSAYPLYPEIIIE